jgi:hypothetical protein
MTSDRRLEQDLSKLLAELDLGPAPDYRDVVVLRTARMRQRPAWTFPERWLPVNVTTQRVFSAPIRWRQIAVVLLIAVLVVALVAFGVGRQQPRRPLPAPYGPAGNGLIVYADKGDLYLGDPVSGTARPVVTGPEADHDPRFSKTGDRFVFLRKTADGVHENLLIANADGTGVRALTTSLMDVTGGDWSADGRTIVIASRRDGRQQMSVIDVGRGETRPLEMGVLDVGDVQFLHPRDMEIAFSMGVSTTYAVKPDGTGMRVLVPATGIQFSPDGSKVAYTVSDSFEGKARMRVHIVGADGQHDLTVANPPDVQYQGSPTWSPDGSSLLVARAHYETTFGAVLTLAVVPGDGGPGVEFGPSRVDGFGDFGWSPDGRMIALGSANQAVDAALITVDAWSYRSVPPWYAANWQRVAP